MLRLPGIILLSLCVLAMPSYAAITCGTACAGTNNAHEDDCCLAIAASTGAPGIDNADAPHDSNHSDTGRHDPCAAPCCGYVAHVLSGAIVPTDDKPLADPLPSAGVVRASGNHDAIFHPPRM